MASQIFDLIEVPEDVERFVNKSFQLADYITYLLKVKGMSQKQLAEKMGKKESEVSKWISGTHNFTIKTISKLEVILGHDLLNIPQKIYVESEVDLSEYQPNFFDFNPDFAESTYVTG
jgi:transcriptional regulator with XRE-family HTH domain